MTTLPRVALFDVVSHGWDYPDYFTGCGVAYTNYSDCVTGYGNTEAEAYDDALEQIAQRGDLDVDDLDARIIDEYGRPSTEEYAGEYVDEAPSYYLSIRWR